MKKSYWESFATKKIISEFINIFENETLLKQLVQNPPVELRQILSENEFCQFKRIAQEDEKDYKELTIKFINNLQFGLKPQFIMIALKEVHI